MPGAHAHERRRPQVPHPPHAGRDEGGPCPLLRRRDRVWPAALARQSNRLPGHEAREHSPRRPRPHQDL